MDTGTLMVKINKYKEVLRNTEEYREAWHKDIKPMLISKLEELLEIMQLEKAEIIIRNNIINLESITLDLGRTSSGIAESIEDTGVTRTMIKSNGSLIYQQLFNGKIMVMILNPYIEGYGDPKPPKQVEILRPDELKEPFIIRHLETLFRDITEWEDFDDDQPSKVNNIGFNPIGFGKRDEGMEHE